MTVTRDEVVAAALALLDETGLEHLTLRRLAGQLGIQAPTLYWHVRDKRELLDLIAAAIMEEALGQRREPQPGQTWWDWLTARARAMRSALLAHRDSALVLAGNRPTMPSLPGIELQLRALADVGFPPPDAMLTLLTLNAYVIGEALDTQREAGRTGASPASPASPARREARAEGHDRSAGPAVSEAYPLIGAAIGGLEPFGASDQRFEYGLDLMITGLRARRDRLARDQPDPDQLDPDQPDRG